MSNLSPDFGGYATKTNIKCSDGRTILPGAFDQMSGTTVPLVWQHGHDSVKNVLGHALLESRDDGIYAYGFLNSSEDGERARMLIHHQDIDSLSIWANNLVEKNKQVVHGVIREVSLVLSGANRGAKIDYINLLHEDGDVDISDEEAIIHSGEFIEIPEAELTEEEEDNFFETEGVIRHADETIAEVFNTLNEKQKTAVYAIIAQVMGEGGGESSMEQSAIQNSEGAGEEMKNNVFDGTTKKDGELEHSAISFAEIQSRAKKVGSLKAAINELQHEGTYGIGSDRANLELLFPDARNVTKEPTWIARRMEWVSKVLTGTKHTPFSRIKSLHADITADAARARGYITANQKVEEVFPVLRRITTPHTIYKKQKLDRDDVIDITDFNVVAWLKSEMRVMLDEEIARAILVGDGRDPVADVDDHIPHTNVRPVYQDDVVYTYNVQVALARTADEMIDDLITAREQYRGSGNPTLFVAPNMLTQWLLLKDADGRRLYRTVGELASELRVAGIVEVPVMDGVENDAATHDLRAIMVNLMDYTVGADRGGEINFFDDFDIDYNQHKYLIETRISGALTVPKSAITLEQSKT